MNTTTALEPKDIAELLRELVRHESTRGMQRELLSRFGRVGQGAGSPARGHRPESAPLAESPAGRELRWVLRRELATQLRVAAKLKLVRAMQWAEAPCALPTAAELASLRVGFAQTALACISSELETGSAAVLANCVLDPMDAWPAAAELAAESLLARDCAAGRYLLGQAELSVGADRRALKTFLGALVAAEQAAQEERVPALSNWAQRALEAEASPEFARSPASTSSSPDKVESDLGAGLHGWTHPWRWDAERMDTRWDLGERVDGSWIHLGLSAAHQSAGRSSLAFGSARSALELARGAERDAPLQSDPMRVHQRLRVVPAVPSARLEACASCFYLAGFELPREFPLEFVVELNQLASGSPNGGEQLRKTLERRLSMTTVPHAELRSRAQALVAQMEAQNSPARSACQSLVDQLK